MFSTLLGKKTRPTIFLGSPEAEAEANANSRVALVDVYEDFHSLLPGLSKEKFMIIGRKGSGKSAFGEYVYALSLKQPNLFCQFVRKTECDLEKVVQLGEAAGIKVDSESLFRWIIYTNILKLFVDNPAMSENKEYALLRQFLNKNSGYIKITELEVKELIEKHGFDVSVEQFKRFFQARFNKSFESKSERAPYYKLLQHLEEVIIKLLKSADNAENGNSYALFFDDLDVGFSVNNQASIDSLVSLIRACRHVNNEVFGKNGIPAKAILLLRDDIESYLSSRQADMSKIFASYASRINWYQEEYSSNSKDENELNLKKFITKRIVYAFKKAGVSINASNPWDSLVEPSGYDRSSFKHIVNQTLFRPRDLLLFFKPLDAGQFSYPLSKNEVSSLIHSYSEELAKEIKNELSSFYSSDQIEMIFRALGEISKDNVSYREAVTCVDNNCQGITGEEVLSYLFDRSIIGTVNNTNGWYTFKCRQPISSATSVSLDRNQKIVVQYGIRAYLNSRGYR